MSFWIYRDLNLNPKFSDGITISKTIYIPVLSFRACPVVRQAHHPERLRILSLVEGESSDLCRSYALDAGSGLSST